MAGRSASVSSVVFLPMRQGGHADDGQVIVIDGDAALVFCIEQGIHGLHVGGINLGVVEADGVVAEFFGNAVALAVHLGGAIHGDFGVEIGQWQLVFGQGLEQALFNAARNVDGIDHHDIPVAGLGLVDNGKAGAGAFELLDVDLDAIGILEGLEQGGVRMVAPDQGVEIGGGGRRNDGDAGNCSGAGAAFQGRHK